MAGHPDKIMHGERARNVKDLGTAGSGCNVCGLSVYNLQQTHLTIPVSLLYNAIQTSPCISAALLAVLTGHRYSLYPAFIFYIFA